MARQATATRDFQPEVVEDDFRLVEADEDDGWDGASTKFPIARVVRHNGMVYGLGDKLTLRASRTHGRWRGPDVHAYETLKAGGCIQGTKESIAKEAEDIAAKARRSMKDGDGNDIPGLDVVKTRREVLAQAPELRRSPEERRKAEHGLSGATQAEAIGEAIASALRGQHAGSEGPASAVNPDGTPLIKE